MEIPGQFKKAQEFIYMKNSSPLKIIFHYLSDHKMRFFSAFLWRLIYEITPMHVPLIVGIIIDGLTGEKAVFFSHIWSSNDPKVILYYAIIGLFLLALVHGYSAYACTLSKANLGRHFVLELRKRLINKAMFLSLDKYYNFGIGDLIDRIIRDTDKSRTFMEKVFIRTITNIIRAGYPIFMLFIIDSLLAIIALSMLIPQRLFLNYFEKKLHSVLKKSRRTDSEFMTNVKENLDGIETIQTSHAEISSINRVNEKAEELELYEIKASQFSAFIKSIAWLMTGVGLCITWWQGGIRVIAGEMTVGTLITFAGFVTFAYRPFQKFSEIIKIYRKGLVSLERIHELLESSSSITVKQDAYPLCINKGKIEFRNVTFGYKNDSPILNNINIQIGMNQLIAVVGRSGCGKTSLIRLLSRLFDPNHGQVIILDQSIQDVTLDSLRSQVLVVPQEPLLFSGTILENITLLHNTFSQEEIEQACRCACALEFIEKFKDGFQTHVTPRGLTLSKGEVQRIAIARALLRRPKILLMDEPTSSLDKVSESGIIQTFLKLKEIMTIIVVTHRLEVAHHADQVIFMDNGCVVEDHTHISLQEHLELFETSIDKYCHKLSFGA